MNRNVVGRVGYVIASAVAILFLEEATVGIAGPRALEILALVASIYAVALFLSMSFSRRVRAGIASVNREIQGEQAFSFRWTKSSDEEWGSFGTRLGGPLLAVLRIVLLIELFAAAFFFGVPSLAFVTTGSGFAVAMLLTLREMASPRDNDGAA